MEDDGTGTMVPVFLQQMMIFVTYNLRSLVSSLLETFILSLVDILLVKVITYLLLIILI